MVIQSRFGEDAVSAMGPGFGVGSIVGIPVRGQGVVNCTNS